VKDSRSCRHCTQLRSTCLHAQQKAWVTHLYVRPAVLLSFCRYAEQYGNDIADLLAPQCGAYYDVWLDGEKFFAHTMEVCASVVPLPGLPCLANMLCLWLSVLQHVALLQPGAGVACHCMGSHRSDV
jgi:hypothetical protein